MSFDWIRRKWKIINSLFSLSFFETKTVLHFYKYRVRLNRPRSFFSQNLQKRIQNLNQSQWNFLDASLMHPKILVGQQRWSISFIIFAMSVHSRSRLFRTYMVFPLDYILVFKRRLGYCWNQVISKLYNLRTQN